MCKLYGVTSNALLKAHDWVVGLQIKGYTVQIVTEKFGKTGYLSM